MKKQKETHRCPFCAEPFGPLTRTRSVPILRQKFIGQTSQVTVATCHRCSSDYELNFETKDSTKSVFPVRSGLVVVFFLGLLLSIADGALSLKLQSSGAYEANPIMGFYMALGPSAFILMKHLLTTSGLVVFLVHHDQGLLGGFLKVRHLLYGASMLFAGVLCYELVLLYGTAGGGLI